MYRYVRIPKHVLSLLAGDVMGFEKVVVGSDNFYFDLSYVFIFIANFD